MAKSTYYFEINKTDLVAIRNEELLIIIKEIFLANKGRYGVRRVYMELKNRGYDVNHKRVQRLMHDAGLLGKEVLKLTTNVFKDLCIALDCLANVQKKNIILIKAKWARLLTM